MKKYLFLLLLLISLSILLASESSPSETVGYYKIGTVQADGSIIAIEPGRWTPVSLPFGTTGDGPNNIFGSQFGFGDNMSDPYNGNGADCYAPDGWFCAQDDTLMMLPGHFYWVYRSTDNPSFNFYIMGKVDPQPFSLEMRGVGGGGWTSFALNSATPVSVYNLGINPLIADNDFGLYDQIVDVTDGSNATYYGEVDGWYSDLGENDYFIKPTHGYYFFSNYDDPDEGNVSDSFVWSYPPTPGRSVVPVHVRSNSKTDTRSKR